MLMAEVRSLHVRTPPRKPVCYKFNVTVSILIKTINYLQVCVELNGHFYARDVNFVSDIKAVLTLTSSVKMKNKELKTLSTSVYFDVFFCSKSV